MSALTVPTTTRRTATPSPRPALRLVDAPAPSRLAPTGPLQAWRRRIGALVLLLALAALGGQALFGGASPDAPAMAPVSAVTVVVQPGQTLWDIAEVHAPADVSPRAYVRQLAVVNGVDNGALDAWQVLRLPTA